MSLCVFKVNTAGDILSKFGLEVGKDKFSVGIA
jgi:hypothetical protein